tara:strand:+ start:307 stop:819 length:513 start_codon:yes stop_codon:yes gene_type:complete
MATETLNPNGGTSYADMSDGDDATFYSSTSNVGAAQRWKINIDGTNISSTAPGDTLDGTIDDLTQEINSTNFSGCPTLTKALITSLQIGFTAGAGPSAYGYRLFDIENPTFSDDATINSATIHGRLSRPVSPALLHEISLVVDYTEPVPPTLLKIKSGNLTLKSGQLIIK